MPSLGVICLVFFAGFAAGFILGALGGSRS